MATTLELSRMTLEEKLREMEALWDDLLRLPETLASPPWHGEILAERKARVAAGEARFLDWSDVQRELRDLG
jgi:Putative addiction module component